ncbi:MAG: hypothetical protein KDA66_20790, partial [Planctomycetaceae bacterium]|nr:hypothetical protein [Planctomycetaceae bacterium]
MFRTVSALTALLLITPALLAQPEETAPRRPAKYHYRQDSPERIKIEKALDTIIEPGVVLKGNPWQLMEALGKHFDIETGVDEPSLLAEGVSDERMPEFELPSGITLQQALDTVFAESEIQFDCHIRFDVLELTSRIRADDFMETIVYELRDLPHEVLSKAGEFEELIQSHTGNWLDDNRGEGTLESIPGGVVIRQTQRRHREILDLLTRLREFNTGPPLTITVSELPKPRGERKSPQLEAIRNALAGPPPEGVEAVKTVGELCAFLDKAYPFRVRLNERSINPEGIGP